MTEKEENKVADIDHVTESILEKIDSEGFISRALTTCGITDIPSAMEIRSTLK